MSEAGEQRVFAEWCDLKRLVWCHVPNGRARNAVTGALLKREGVKPGVPDNLIFSKPLLRKAPWPHVGVAIEMKADKGVTTREQEDWLEELEALGWATYVARGASDAIKFMLGLGY